VGFSPLFIIVTPIKLKYSCHSLYRLCLNTLYRYHFERYRLSKSANQNLS